MARDRFQKQSLGAMYNSKIKEARILLVGAGGIGCELLKNLVLTGFGEVHIIDLDTIDLSNLNRQFLFRHEHIKKAKALVAKEAAQKFNPSVKLEAYHANIKDAQFNINWFASFNLVFNALDNLDARRHVNKMCLFAGVPLIESGTTGFNGQVQVILRGKTACYDCNEKMTPKSFPVCTIRSTPSQPIHCIVWAKSYLLPELFGVSEDETPDLDTSEDAENADEIKNLREEAQALTKIRESMGTDEFAQLVFDKVFKEDVERLQRMEDMWKMRRPPEPLSHDQASADASSIDAQISNTDQRTWTRAETFKVFFDSLQRLSRRLQDDQAAALKSNLPKPIITFDKDDVDTLDFVAAASNIRSLIFGIEPKSKFDIKQMAGNIIPAIATTNAMIAGLCVMQAFKVLKGDLGRTKMVFLNRAQMSAGAYEQPNPDCAVCGVATARVWIHPARATLGDLVNGILREDLGYGDMNILSEKGEVYDAYGDLDDNLPKTLGELEVGAGSFLTVVDEEEGDEEEPRVNLQIAIELDNDEDMSEEGKAVVLSSKPEIARRAKKKPVAVDIAVNGNGTTESNGISTTTAKRKRNAEDAGLEEGGAVKKTLVQMQAAKPLPTDAQGTTLLDEVEEGALVIDDD